MQDNTKPLMPSKQILEMVEGMIERQELENKATALHIAEMTMIGDFVKADNHKKYLANGNYLVSNLRLVVRRIKGELR